MTPFRDLPIRRKLLLTTLVSSAFALGLASAAFLTWDMVQFRSDASEELAAQVRLIAENSALTLPLRDREVATANLSVLQERPLIEYACLYDASGALFAAYRRDPELGSCPPDPPTPSRLHWQRIDLAVPVVLRGDQVGTLYVRRDLTDLYSRLRMGSAMLAVLLVLTVGAASLTASGMHRAIAAPLLHLAETARTVSTMRDNSLRAVPTSGDEIGVVVYAFNEMLDRISERTEQLSRTNAELEREIEERRRVEEERTAALARERDANRLKDEFLATLSHELRTPLNAVLGWARVLRTADLDPRMQARALESIERNARAQTRLIEDLLEISRIVTGKLRLAVREIDLAAVVDAAVEVVRPAAAARQLRIALDIDVRPAMTVGDPDRLQQVCWNLLSNAVKFTPPGGVVSIELRRTIGYRLIVRDSGAGIEPRFLPYVFEPFRQADGSPSRAHGGLGLGLAIAKQIVELHGGTITAVSEGRDRGSMFEVRLPSAVAAASVEPRAAAPVAAAPPEREEDRNQAMLRGVHVLVVDDEEDARVLLETALRQYGASVIAVGNARDALASFDRRPPDVLLSDIGMPDQDGYRLIRRVRARAASKGGAIPAVAITAYASPQDRRTAEAAGYQAHITKPFEPDEVARLVATLARAA